MRKKTFSLLIAGNCLPVILSLGILGVSDPQLRAEAPPPLLLDLTDSSHFLSLSLGEARTTSAMFLPSLPVSPRGDCSLCGWVCLR